MLRLRRLADYHRLRPKDGRARAGAVRLGVPVLGEVLVGAPFAWKRLAGGAGGRTPVSEHPASRWCVVKSL